MTRNEIVGVIVHSTVTGFLLQAAIEGAASQDVGVWVGITYVGATIAANMYPDLMIRIWVMCGALVASFAWKYLLYHVGGK